MELVPPSARFRERFLEALAEYRAAGESPSRSELIESDGFDAFVAELHALSDPASAPEGYAPRTTWWLVDGDRYLGRLAIRQGLIDELRLSCVSIIPARPWLLRGSDSSFGQGCRCGSCPSAS
jgi:predicted acetyltransferase